MLHKIIYCTVVYLDNGCIVCYSKYATQTMPLRYKFLLNSLNDIYLDLNDTNKFLLSTLAHIYYEKLT